LIGRLHCITLTYSCNALSWRRNQSSELC